jgi:phage major head subunit gpT-like protein
MADDLDTLETSLVKMVATKTGKSEADITDWLAVGKDIWLTAQQAVDFGVADEITTPIEAAASFDATALNGAPTDKLQSLFPALVTNAAAAAQPQRTSTMKKLKGLKTNGGVQLALASLTAIIANAIVGETTREKLVLALASAASLTSDDVTGILTGTVSSVTAEQAQAIATTLGAELELTDPVTPPAAPAAVDANAIAAQAIERDRARTREIRALGATAKLTDAEINRLIDDGSSLDQARAYAIDAMARRDASNTPRNHHIRMESNTGGLREAVSQAILHRVDPAKNKLEGAAREFGGQTLMETARAMLHYMGVDTSGMSRNMIAARAMQSTSDFPAILADVANKSLRQGYMEAPRTFMPFCRKVNASDFKNINRVQLGEAPALERVNEKGEFNVGALKDDKASYALATYGKIISLSRQTIINDDLDAFSRMPQLFGAAGARLENATEWGLITANAALADGVALFHSTHKNLGTTGAPSETTLTEMRKLMRKQTGLDGTTVLNVMPQYLMVPAALETTAEKLLSAVQATATSGVNPFAGKLQLIVEPLLDAASGGDADWYASASPSQIDTIEYAYLEGEEGVYLETQTGFETDGVQLKARLDFGAGVIDHRGLFANK